MVDSSAPVNPAGQHVRPLERLDPLHARNRFLALVKGRLKLPVVASPLFIISQLELVIAQCRAGIIGSFPSLNARPVAELDRWLRHLSEQLTQFDAPYAVNLIVHKSNDRLQEDLALCIHYKVPIIITSLGARADVNAAVHAYGGIVLHDVISDEYAHKAIEKGADGLILVAAGAGGHAGTLSPFALIQEVRRWYTGLVVLSGSIATGRALLAALAMGADLGYIGSAFIATEEAHADARYKQMVVDSTASDIVYSNLFTGVNGNYLRPSLVNAGLDPEKLTEHTASAMNFGSGSITQVKAWRDIWGCGQGIGAINSIVKVETLVSRLTVEYHSALSAIGTHSTAFL